MTWAEYKNQECPLCFFRHRFLLPSPQVITTTTTTTTTTSTTTSTTTPTMTSLRINTTPIELTTTEGYNEFVKSPLAAESSTVFPDNSDHGYVMDTDNEIIATVALNVRASLENAVPSYGSPYGSPETDKSLLKF